MASIAMLNGSCGSWLDPRGIGDPVAVLTRSDSDNSAPGHSASSAASASSSSASLPPTYMLASGRGSCEPCDEGPVPPLPSAPPSDSAPGSCRVPGRACRRTRRLGDRLARPLPVGRVNGACTRCIRLLFLEARCSACAAAASTALATASAATTAAWAAASAASAARATLMTLSRSVVATGAALGEAVVAAGVALGQTLVAGGVTGAAVVADAACGGELPMNGRGCCIRRARGEATAALADRGVVGGVMTNRWMRMTCDCMMSRLGERRTEDAPVITGGVAGTGGGGGGRPAARLSRAAIMARTREAADGHVSATGEAGGCVAAAAAPGTDDACPTCPAAGDTAALPTCPVTDTDSVAIACGVKGVPIASFAPPASGRQRSGSSSTDVGTDADGRPYTTAASCRATAAGMTLSCRRRRRRGGAAEVVAAPLRTTSGGADVAEASALRLRGTRRSLTGVERGGSTSG